SWYESFAFPPLEAMACGCAVVATPRAAADIARDGENALIVPARDAHAMSRAVVELWRDADARSRLVARGVQNAGQFTWPRAIEAFEAQLEEIAAAPDGAPEAARAELLSGATEDARLP